MSQSELQHHFPLAQLRICLETGIVFVALPAQGIVANGVDSSTGALTDSKVHMLDRSHCISRAFFCKLHIPVEIERQLSPGQVVDVISSELEASLIAPWRTISQATRDW